MRVALETVAGLKNIRLIDAHSFCWMLATLLKFEAEGSELHGRSGADAGRVLGAREKSIWEMKDTVLRTVQQSRGQVEERTVKNKELLMSEAEFEAFITQLMDIQKSRCALTGLELQFRGAHEDENFLPSLDRIDSNGH